MTRRGAIFFGLAVPCWAYFPKEFWDEKNPSDWNLEEIHQLLSKSPWAKEASVSYWGGQNGPIGSSQQRTTSRRGMAGGRGATTPDSPNSLGQWKATCRWESALPVREALKLKKGALDVEGNYILNLLGDVPSMGPSDDDTPAQREQRLEMLKQYTKLEHKGDQIAVNRVEPAPGNAVSPAGTLFYFSRELALRAEDKQATFMTKMGPIEVKCKFTLKDMVYRGKLEL
jgi:hypothetical protein